MSQPNVGSMWGFSSCHWKRALFSPLFLLLVSIPAWAATVNGFVTKIDSPTEFDVGSLHVILDKRVRCEKKVYLPWRPSAGFVPCNTLDFTVGSDVRLIGIVQPDEQIVVNRVRILKLQVLAIPRHACDGSALIEEIPQIQQGTQGLSGTAGIDGHIITVTPQTEVFSSPVSKIFGYRIIGGPHVHAKSHDTSVHDLVSPSLLKPNVWATYHATCADDGTLTATRLHLWPNQIDAKGEKFLQMFTAKIVAPDYRRDIPGSVQYKHGGPIQILPDQGVQEYVSQLGVELAPQYQKELAANDPTKINFRFYVVHPFIDAPGNHLVQVDGEMPVFGSFAFNYYTYNSPKRNSTVENIIAMPDGVVLIPDVALARLHNKAQLIAILTYAITSIIQRQAYIAWMNATSPHARHTPMDDLIGFIREAAFWQDEQLLRIGIRQMYLAGYDIREAPFAWAVAQGKPVNNPTNKFPQIFWSQNKSSVQNKFSVPWYAFYAFNYISQYYKDVDYSKLKRGEKEYQQFLQELYKADPSLPHPNAAAATSAAATK